MRSFGGCFPWQNSATTISSRASTPIRRSPKHDAAFRFRREGRCRRTCSHLPGRELELVARRRRRRHRSQRPAARGIIAAGRLARLAQSRRRGQTQRLRAAGRRARRGRSRIPDRVEPIVRHRVHGCADLLRVPAAVHGGDDAVSNGQRPNLSAPMPAASVHPGEHALPHRERSNVSGTVPAGAADQRAVHDLSAPHVRLRLPHATGLRRRSQRARAPCGSRAGGRRGDLCGVQLPPADVVGEHVPERRLHVLRLRHTSCHVCGVYGFHLSDAERSHMSERRLHVLRLPDASTPVPAGRQRASRRDDADADRDVLPHLRIPLSARRDGAVLAAALVRHRVHVRRVPGADGELHAAERHLPDHAGAHGVVQPARAIALAC